MSETTEKMEVAPEESKNNEDLKKLEEDLTYIDPYQIYATLAFVVVIIFIGVPMWWKTTDVYRVSLPYDEIGQLSDHPMKSTIRIGIMTKMEDRGNILISELEKKFENHFIFNMKFEHFHLEDSVMEHTKTPAQLEAEVLKKYPLLPGDFIFIEWEKLKDDVLVTSDRTAFISDTVSSLKVHQVLTSWILQEYKLKSILGSLTTVKGRQIRHNSAPPQPHYDVLVSILNPRPDLQNVQFNVRAAAEAYITPFLNELSSISNFTLKSQWKYQVMIESTSKQIQDDSKLGRHYMLSEENLPHIITSLEKKLGSQISNNPCIHLVVYVPPCQTAPLRIYKKDGTRASTNNIESFISAKWGGILIANPSEATCLQYLESQEFSSFHIHAQDVMPVLLYHLRKIFDLENNIPLSGANIVPFNQIQPRSWEVDTYKRTNAIYFVESATSTLKSLIQLLGDIDYIVINDEVGLAVKDSYANIQISRKLLNENKLDAAVIYSKKAYASAERAFFDPSLLALLYFPGEQKYAIYIPLFLPIMIPVVFSILPIKRFIQQRKKEKAE